MFGISSLLFSAGLSLCSFSTSYQSTYIQFYTDDYGGANTLWEENSSVGLWTLAKDASVTRQPLQVTSKEIMAVDASIVSAHGLTGSYYLKNPVVIFEGIDFNDEEKAPSSDQNNPLGKPGMSAQKLATLLERKGILDGLLSNNNDFVVVNYQHSSQSIWTNGDFAFQVLEWVSRKMAQGPGPQGTIKVLGLSMGGLIARDAVWKYLKARQANPALANISLYISMDSPHQGANLPIGLMSQLKFMSDNSSILDVTDGSLTSLYNLMVNADAPQQMLLRDGSGAVSKSHSDFQQLYNLRRSLPGVRQVAFSNGSLVGAGQEYLPNNGFNLESNTNYTASPAKLFTPLKTALTGPAFHVKEKWTFEVDGAWPGRYTGLSANFLSGFDGSNPISYSYIYRKKNGSLFDDENKDDTHYSVSSVDLDHAPGGYFPFYETIYQRLTSALDLNWRNFLKMPDMNYRNRIVEAKSLEAGQACFIPTVSAIDYQAPNGTETTLRNDYLLANLKSLDPNIASHTSFSSIHGVDETDLSSSRDAEVGGFFKNQFHVLGKSVTNTWRVLCEVQIANGTLPAGSNCDDLSLAPAFFLSGLRSSLMETRSLLGDYGAPLLDGDVLPLYDNEYFSNSTSYYERTYVNAHVWWGIPFVGWNSLYKLPYMAQAGDFISVDFRVPVGAFWWMGTDLVLKGAEDGCGFLQLGSKPISISTPGWQRLTWQVPSYYAPECNDYGQNFDNLASIELKLNSGSPRVPDAHIEVTGIKVSRDGQMISAPPPPQIAKSQVFPTGRGSSFVLGSWGNYQILAGNPVVLSQNFDQPWSGIVFYSGGRDISAYKYIQIEFKPSVPTMNSAVMLFVDDHPDVTTTARSNGFRPLISSVVNPYKKQYNYIGCGTLLSTSTDGYETRRIPLSWLTTSTTIGKIILQQANFGRAPTETLKIRSITFTN